MDVTEVKTAFEGKINSYSGVVIDLVNPKPEMFRATDIAQGLGNICRFGGQITEFYSVAQHSVLVCALAPVELKRAALLHDAAEAYLQDIISPLKHIIGDVYKPLEAKMQAAIFERFNVPIEYLDYIKPYDIQAYEMEKLRFKKGNPTEWVNFWRRLDYDVMNWPPAYARMRMFVELERYFEKEVHNA